MRFQYWAWIALIFFCISCASTSENFGLKKTVLSDLKDPENQYFQKLYKKAVEKQLHQNRFWHLLLHYRADGNGYESEQDAISFFFAPDGKTNPLNELKFTLKSFFNHSFPENKHPQCIFVARYHWLNSKLDFDPQYIPVQSCPKYKQWYDNLTPTGLSLIFPSYDQSTPGSMFGHTLLVLRSEENRSTPLLDTAVNFGAYSSPDDSPLTFMYKGLFGLYPGVFGRHPYYFKIQEYVNQELRDIWEYKLNISKKGLRDIQRHTWELDHAFFDYYFFRENCAYYLLGLIEIGNPSLHLRDEYSLKTLPTDTVRQLLRVKGLISDQTYFPSRANKVRQKLDRLSIHGQEEFYRVIQSSSDQFLPVFQTLPLKERILLLEAVAEYLVIVKKPGSKGFRMSLLKQRSQLEGDPQRIKYKIITSPPETGHKTTRLGISAGSSADNAYVDIEGRGVFQGILDNDQAYLPFKQIEIGKGRLRYYPETNRLLIEEINFVNTISLDYTSPFKPNPGTWKGEVALKQERVSENCSEENSCLTMQLNAGYGTTKKLGSSVFYSMLDTSINLGSAYEKDYQLALGVDVGTLIRFGYDWKAFLSLRYSDFFLGETDRYPAARLGIRYQISTNADMRVEHLRIKNYVESALVFKIHL